MVVGVLAMVLLLLQPWASCPEIDDVPAGCPVQGAQATVQAATMLIVVVGALGLLGSLLVPNRPRRPSAEGV